MGSGFPAVTTDHELEPPKLSQKQTSHLLRSKYFITFIYYVGVQGVLVPWCGVDMEGSSRFLTLALGTEP